MKICRSVICWVIIGTNSGSRLLRMPPLCPRFPCRKNLLVFRKKVGSHCKKKHCQTRVGSIIRHWSHGSTLGLGVYIGSSSTSSEVVRQGWLLQSSVLPLPYFGDVWPEWQSRMIFCQCLLWSLSDGSSADDRWLLLLLLMIWVFYY